MDKVTVCFAREDKTFMGKILAEKESYYLVDRTFRGKTYKDQSLPKSLFYAEEVDSETVTATEQEMNDKHQEFMEDWLKRNKPNG
jgi:hypothetical protein